MLLLIPFAAYAFRRGLVFLLLIFILPMPEPAQAVEWGQLWKNNDQRAMQQLQQGDAQQAAELFEAPAWRAAAEYRAGNYAKSAEILQSIDNADAHYNRGNALAKNGAYDEALQAYQRALELQPEHEDARFNKQQVEQALQNQQNEDQQSSEDESDSNQPSEDDQSGTNKTDDNQSGDRKSQNDQSPDSQSEEDQSKNDQATGDQSNSDQGNDKQSGQNPPQTETDSSQPESASENTEQQAQQAADKPDGESADEPLDLQQQQTQQWLKKIPDDPGGLLRRKFHYQYGREPRQDEQQAW